jgi:anti-sigma factor RsiW
MNINKNIINDLLPLYVVGECSPDTRALVEEYLQRNPQEAEELRRTINTRIPGMSPSPASLDEVRALRNARRQVRLRSTVMGFAIFFSLCPFSVYSNGVRAHWLLIESPLAALAYAGVGLCLWVIYFAMRHRAKTV